MFKKGGGIFLSSLWYFFFVFIEWKFVCMCSFLGQVYAVLCWKDCFKLLSLILLFHFGYKFYIHMLDVYLIFKEFDIYLKYQRF